MLKVVWRSIRIKTGEKTLRSVREKSDRQWDFNVRNVGNFEK